MTAKQPTYELKVPVWAEGEIEVTGFISKFAHNDYPPTYDPFWGEGYRRQLPITLPNNNDNSNDNNTTTTTTHQCIFDIPESLFAWHTTPQNYTTGIFNHIAESADATVVVFCLNRAGSLEKARALIEDFRKCRIEKDLQPVPVALVGNRMAEMALDGSGRRRCGVGERVVTVEEMEELKMEGVHEVVAECCAETDEQVVLERIFADLGRVVLVSERMRREREREAEAAGVVRETKKRPWMRAVGAIRNQLMGARLGAWRQVHERI